MQISVVHGQYGADDVESRRDAQTMACSVPHSCILARGKIAASLLLSQLYFADWALMTSLAFKLSALPSCDAPRPKHGSGLTLHD